MARTVKIVTNTPGAAPKAQPFADIKGQGKIPYGETKEVKIPTTLKRQKARGTGAAIKGTSFLGY